MDMNKDVDPQETQEWLDAIDGERPSALQAQAGPSAQRVEAAAG